MQVETLLKPVFSRKLKNGNCVLVATDSEPLVVDETFADSLIQNSDIIEKCDEEIITAFKDSGFFASENTDVISIPEEPNNLKWKILRNGLIVVGILAIITILITIPFIGIPTGNQIVSNDLSLLETSIFIIGFSLFTTVIHEIMHMIYARTLNKKSGGLNLTLKNAIATVSMTHIWVWSLIGRISAVSAGIVSDLLFLALLSVGRLFYNNLLMVVASAILWLKIIWQFRFHKNCDGSLMAIMLLDNPMLNVKNSSSDIFSCKNERHIWYILKAVGILIDIVIFMFWLVPFALDIFNYIFDKFLA